jgi:lambda repressor-like predicted transcriptional regulator
LRELARGKMKNNTTGVSARIRALLAEQGLTKIDLAKKADVSYRTIFSAVHDQGNLQERIVGKIAIALGTSVEYLLSGSGEKKTAKESPPVWGTNGLNQDITLKAALSKISRELDISFETVSKCFSELANKSKNGEIK